MSSLGKRKAHRSIGFCAPSFRGKQIRRTSYNLPTADAVNVPLSEPSELLASFTPDASKKLLKALLDDPELRPGVTAHIHAHLAESFPAYIASIRHHADRATARMHDPPDHREKGNTCSGDYVKACAPFLHDVVRAARMPVPGAPREALALLRRIHGNSIQDMENVDDGVEEREQFDEVTDGLMVALLRRMRETGDEKASDDQWLEELRKKLLKTLKDTEDFDMPEDLFSRTINLLEDWLVIEVGSSDSEEEEEPQKVLDSSQA